MGPGPDRDTDQGVMGVGIALLGEGLDVAIAVLIDVIDNPRLLLPARALPSALADGHGRLLF